MATDFTEAEVTRILDEAYPVGTVIQSDVDPNTYLRGSWQRFANDRLLRATQATTTHNTDDLYGGSDSVNLGSWVPSHYHDVSTHAHMMDYHTHARGSHSHSITARSHTHSWNGSHTHPFTANEPNSPGWATKQSSGTAYAGFASTKWVGVGPSNNATSTTTTSQVSDTTTSATTAWSGTKQSTSSSSTLIGMTVTSQTVGTSSPSNVMLVPPYRTTGFWKRVS